jgi:hypothetical protein
MIASFKTKRARSKTPTSKAPKRSRVSTAPAPKAREHEGLSSAPFPAPIRALPHVTELIDAFRMTPREAAQRAVTTGQSKWLGQLISSDGINVTSPDMLADAAAKGYDGVVELLLPALLNFRHESNQARWKTLLAAVVAASANGCYSTLPMMLPKLHVRELRGDEQNVVVTAVEKVLDEAAERECLDAVALIVKHAEDESYAYTIGEKCRALSRAAAGGHTALVEYLLSLNKWYWKWDLPHAVDAAVEMKQTAIATKLYGDNPEYDKKSFFVCLARDGYTGAVEYFFPNVRSNDTVLKEAVLEAAISRMLWPFWWRPSASLPRR